MAYYLVVYSSVTLANRVKKLLSKQGEYGAVIHSPRCISHGGCSYSLKTKKHSLELVKEISNDIGITIRGIYEESIKNSSKTYERIE